MIKELSEKDTVRERISTLLMLSPEKPFRYALSVAYKDAVKSIDTIAKNIVEINQLVESTALRDTIEYALIQLARKDVAVATKASAALKDTARAGGDQLARRALNAIVGYAQISPDSGYEAASYLVWAFAYLKKEIDQSKVLDYLEGNKGRVMIDRKIDGREVAYRRGKELNFRDALSEILRIGAE